MKAVSDYDPAVRPVPKSDIECENCNRRTTVDGHAKEVFVELTNGIWRSVDLPAA